MSVAIQEKTIPVIGVPLAPKNPVNIVNPAEKPKKPKNAPKKAPKEPKIIAEAPQKNADGLIISTGLPKSENGNYVKSAEGKLTDFEKRAYDAYVKKRLGELLNQSLSAKQRRRHEFRFRLIWLLNKSVLMKGEWKRQRKAQAIQKEPVKMNFGGPNKQNEPVSINFAAPSFPTSYASSQSMSQPMSQPMSTGGYQYLDDNWINADKPWRNFQTTAAPTTSTLTPIQSYTPEMMQPQNYPDFSQMMFTTPPPAFAPIPVSQLAPQPISQSEPSLYRREFPVPDPPFSTLTMEPTVEALEVSEAELARQKRLIEIEEELQAINAKKLQMQMEAEIREKELELAHRQQMMELRERELRDRECFEHGRRSSERHHQYDGYSNYDNYSTSSSSSHHHHRSPVYDQRKPASSSSYSSSHSRQIAIERVDMSSSSSYSSSSSQQKRRHGSDERRREGSAHLKRSVDSRSSTIDSHRSGRIQPAVQAKKPRHYHPKKGGGELQMQAISDEEH